MSDEPLSEEEAEKYAATLYDELLTDVEVVADMYASTVLMAMDLPPTVMDADAQEAFELGIRAGLVGTLHVLGNRDLLVLDVKGGKDD